jgi:hypothetical protein
LLSGSPAGYSHKQVRIDGQTGLGIYQGTDLVALLQGKAAQSIALNNTDQVLFI